MALRGKGNPDLRGFIKFLDLTEISLLTKCYWRFSKLVFVSYKAGSAEVLKNS